MTQVNQTMTFEEYVDVQVKSILSPWMVNFLRYDPEKYLKNVKCPVFAFNGSKDCAIIRGYVCRNK
jgi:hypothetical protein